jgi:hypothetical protein
MLQIHDNVGDSSYRTSNGENVLESDAVFSKAAHTYKNIVTHYFASKIEVWYALILKPLFGIDMGLLVHEFQTGRGAIHCHVAAYSNHESTWQTINDALFNFSVAIHDALVDLDMFIYITASEEQLIALKIHDARGGMAWRQKYLQLTNEGKQRWEAFNDLFQDAEAQLNYTIGGVLETEYGFSAMHHGTAPQQWVKPGGQPDQGYRSAFRDMMSSKDVLEARELKSLKLQREKETLLRRVNLTNHCLTHKCSGYCWKCSKKYETYNPSVHSNEQLDSSSSIDENGNTIIKTECKECRMGFGHALKKDYSGENNLTGGAAFLAQPEIVFDRNQMPKFMSRRNHPRIISHPHAALYFGANNDIQPILINSSFIKTMEHFSGDPDEYANYFSNLNTLRWGGGLNTIMVYILF